MKNSVQCTSSQMVAAYYHENRLYLNHFIDKRLIEPPIVNQVRFGALKPNRYRTHLVISCGRFSYKGGMKSERNK